MKKRGIFFALIVILILSIILPSAIANIFTSNEVNTNVKITGKIDVKSTSGDSSIKYININTSFVPRNDYRQTIDKIKFAPDAVLSDRYVSYRIDNPTYGAIEYYIDADMTMKNKIVGVKNKVNFPVSGLTPDIIEYTKPAGTIDSDNQDIIRLSNNLVSGEDDLFYAVNKLASWTKSNIQYNLSTMTASVTEPASWVLTNRYGVCDEISNLFIALCRSVGIPAKFVSGIAYTESPLFSQKWGTHGWAEVYFPGYGWVEYDVTYGEFGYIDPTHMKMNSGEDIESSVTKYNWYGRNVDVKSYPADIKTTIKSFSGEAQKKIDATIYPEYSQIGMNSYELINLKIKNNMDYYVSEEYTLFSANEAKIEDKIKNIVLKPNEEKEINWILYIGNMDADYTYTFPVTALNSRNETVGATFGVRYDAPVFSLEEISEIAKSKSAETENRYSRYVNISCNAEKTEFYIDEENYADCEIINTGNYFFKNLSVCMQNDCSAIELGISQKKNLRFIIKPDTSAGAKEKRIVALSEGVTKAARISYTQLDKPEIQINELKYPETVGYKDNFSIEFLVSKKSFSNPKNVEITIDLEGYKNTWIIEEMSQDKRFVIDVKAKNLAAGENRFEVKAEYTDNRAKKYEDVKAVRINLSGLNIIEKVLVFFRSTTRFFFSNQGFTQYVIIAVTVFLIILELIFLAHKMDKSRGKNIIQEEKMIDKDDEDVERKIIEDLKRIDEGKNYSEKKLTREKERR